MNANKPVPSVSDKGGVIGRNMEVKGPGREVWGGDRKKESGKVDSGEQGGLGKQRKGYGEQTGVECGKKEGNGLPKPGGGNKGKDSNVGREVTGKPAGW